LLDQFPREVQSEVLEKLRRTLKKYDHSNASHKVGEAAIDVIEQDGRHYFFFHLHVFDIQEKEAAALFGLSPADEIDAIMAESESLQAYTWLICGILSLSLGTTTFFWRARNESARLAEVHLQVERARAKEMFDKSESVQWIIHPGSGRFVDVNQAACNIYGYSKEQFLGLKITDINVMDPEAMFAEMRAVERGEQKYFNFCHRLASGELRDVEVYATNTHIDEESYIYSIIHDVTEKKRTEEELKEVNADLLRQTEYANEMVAIAEEAIRAKSAFLATMSHEIRTPLNAVIGMAALLEKSNLSDSQKDFARTIVSSSDGLLSLINDILDYSKVEAGKMELEAAPFELCDTINTTLDILSVKAAEKGIALTYVIDADAPAIIVGDSARIRQVILNLLSNAVKFTDAGEVSLSVRAEAKAGKKWHLNFAVSDTGMGMDAGACATLFKPFSQGDSSINRKYGGTGLGLAISQRIVEAMGGKIEVESEVDKGSTFHFSVEFEALSESVKVFDLPDGDDL
jgi:PAS domain S-box-containing protein